MEHMRLRFQKGDIAVIAGIVLLAVLIFILFLPKEKSAAAYAEIYQDGKLLKIVALSEEQEFTVTGRYINTITVYDGKITVTQSNCPGEDCVGCGWISTAGRSIVCLPNELEIRIVAGNSDVDFVVG